MPALISLPHHLARTFVSPLPSGGQPIITPVAPPALLARAQDASFSLHSPDVEWAKTQMQAARRSLAAAPPPGVPALELLVFRLQTAFALVAAPDFPGSQAPAPSPGLAW